MSVPDGDIKAAVVVETQRKLRLTLRQRWLILVIVVVAVLSIAGAFAYRKWVNDHAVTAQDVNTVQNNANLTDSEHGLQSGLSAYNTAISNASNKTVQSQLYTQAANLALQNNAVSTALSYAIKADNDSNSSATSSFVAAIYQQEGNNAEAVTYYNKAATEAPALSQARDSGKQFYLHAAQAAEKAE